MTEWYLFGSRFAETVTLTIFSFLLGLIPWALDKRKLRIDDYELWVDVLSESMANPAGASPLSPLEYSVGGTPVKDPHRAELCLWVTGKKDFTPERFNDKSFTIDLGVPVVSELERFEHHDAAEADVEITSNGVVIHPSILRRDAAMRWIFVTDGEPSLGLNRPFHDTAVASWFESYAKPSRSRKAKKTVGVLMMIFSFPLLILIGVLLRPLDIPIGPFALAAGLLITGGLVGGIQLTVSSDAPGRRLTRVLRELRRRIPGSLPWRDYGSVTHPLGELRHPYRREVAAAAKRVDAPSTD